MQSTAPPLAELRRELARRSLIRVLRANPSWSLLDLFELAGVDPKLGAVFAEVRLGDLDGADACGRRSRAQKCKGADFDELVLEVLDEVAPTMVAAPYLRERLGGPRWKLTKSLARLGEAGKVRIVGRTSDRRYGARARRPS